MKEYILPKNGGTAKMTVLESIDLVDVLALQEATSAALPADMKMFVRSQPMSYFQDLLTKQNGVIIGIRAQPRNGGAGELIAQMAIMGPMELREAIFMRSITKNDITFHHAALTDSVVIFKSMAVHPNWRGNELSQHLIKFALELPLVRVAAHTFAQISSSNRRSWDTFVRQGFGIVAAAYDPEDKQPRFVFQKPAFGFDFAPAIIADEVDPKQDFAAIAHLTQREGMVGIFDADLPEKLTFMRSRDALNLMPTLAKVTAAE